MTTQLIDQLITRAAEAEAAKQATEDQHRQEFIEHAEQAIAATLGELWNTLQPHIVKAIDGDRRLRVLIGGEGLEAMHLAPFWVHYDTFNEVCLHWSERPDSLKPFKLETAGVFFAERRAAFAKWQQEELKKRIQRAVYRVSRLSYSPTPEQSDAALAELLELAPERADEWRALRAEWQADYDRKQAQQAETDRQQVLQADYQAVYAGYWQEHQRVLSENRRRIGELQKDLDGAFTIWRLEYGVVAYDEDSGERFVDILHVYVTHATPDAAGFWTILDRNRITPRRYAHVVSVEGPLLSRPTNDSYGVHGYMPIKTTGGHLVAELHFNLMAVSAADVADMANTVMLAYPDEPQPPADLMEYYAADARRKAINQDEIPY